MTFTTYEAQPRYVMIHRSDCGQARRARSGCVEQPDLATARTYAQRLARDRAEGWCHCQVCMPGKLPRHPWMDRRDARSD